MPARRILIVDDDESFRHTIQEGLRFEGYEVCEAGDGPEAMGQAEALHPDAILMDVRMPGIDGYETCRGLKANASTQAIPVIFLTAVTDHTLNSLAYAAGGIACIMKPCRLETLTGVIEAAIANQIANHRKGNGARPEPARA